MKKLHQGTNASRSPARDPNVPGANGIYPRPQAVATKSAKRGLRAGNADGVAV
jgi:hypothetical protein